jgi:hypothetical protein
MSLDVYLQGESVTEDCECTCGHKHTRTETVNLYNANITHNLNRMADVAGIYHALWRPEEIGVTYALQLIPILREGLACLLKDPKEFEQYNPKNGWGSYSGLVSFVRAYLAACEEYPDATVSVSR